MILGWINVAVRVTYRPIKIVRSPMYAASPLPTRVDLSREFVGPCSPLVKLPKRDQYLVRMNETITLIDEINKKNITCKNTQQLHKLTDKVQLIESYKPMIEQHIERRVSNFLNQLVICYQTKLHFEIAFTTDQGQSAVPIKANLQGNKVIIKRESAHSSTLPSIDAYDLAAWKAHLKGGPKPESFVYVKGSECYRCNNSTLEMPFEVNKADDAIDLLLRADALALLNQSSRGTITPQEGLEQFIDKALQHTYDSYHAAVDKGIETSLALFWHKLNDVKVSLQDTDNFDRLISIQMGEDNSEDLRSTAYKLRYKAIRSSQIAQSLIYTKIKTVKEEVFATLRTKLEAVHFFEDVFRRLVIINMPTRQDQNSMKKFWNYTEPSPKNNKEVENFNITHQCIVDNCSNRLVKLIDDLSCEMAKMRQNEVNLRGEITRVLRGSLGWSQRELSTRINALYPQLPSSQPTISRIENNKKLIDRDYAEKLSQVFEVDQIIFMPADFSSI